MARPEKTPSQITKRVQMDMTERSVARLKALQDVTEASSYAEVLRNALRLYEALIKEVEAGGEILVRRGEVVEKLGVFYT